MIYMSTIFRSANISKTNEFIVKSFPFLASELSQLQ